jgi:hypothetical protein
MMAYRLGGLNGMEDDGVDNGEVYTREGGQESRGWVKWRCSILPNPRGVEILIVDSFSLDSPDDVFYSCSPATTTP